MTLVWVGFGVLNAWYAAQKGRDPMIWFFIGILLGIIGLIVLFFLPKVNKSLENENPEPDPDEPMVELVPAPPKVLYPEQKEWYYLDRQNRQAGPVGIGVLRQEWNKGELDVDTYVWCEGLEKWFKVKELNELESSLTVPLD